MHIRFISEEMGFLQEKTLTKSENWGPTRSGGELLTSGKFGLEISSREKKKLIAIERGNSFA